jgi:hypothetical protein
MHGRTAIRSEEGFGLGGGKRVTVIEGGLSARTVRSATLGPRTRAVLHIRTEGGVEVTVSERVQPGKWAGVTRHMLDRHLLEALALADTASRCHAETCAAAACWLGQLTVKAVADSA